MFDARSQSTGLHYSQCALVERARCLILLLGFIVAPNLFSEDLPSVKLLVSETSNNDIGWHTSTLGILPSLQNKRCQAILASSTKAIPLLRNALADDEKVVVAHVLLSFIYERSVHNNNNSWLGLGLKFPSKGNVEYDKGSFKQVRSYWEEFFKDGVPSPPSSENQHINQPPK